MFAVGMTPAGEHLLRDLDDAGRRCRPGSRSSTGSAPCGAARSASATPMLFCIAFLFQFLIAGLTGIMLAVAPFDWQLTDTYFVVGAFPLRPDRRRSLFTIFAAIYYWFPKATGRMLSERLGKLALLAVADRLPPDLRPACTSRACSACRGASTPTSRAAGWDMLNLIAVDRRALPGAGGAHLRVQRHRVAASRRRRPATIPWDAWTLEWSTTSPPPEYNFADAAGGAQPPPAVGPEASGRSGLEVRMSAGNRPPTAAPASPGRCPPAGRVGMACLILTESAFFSIFVVAYLFYIGKSTSGPTPREVLDLPDPHDDLPAVEQRHDRASRCARCARGTARASDVVARSRSCSACRSCSSPHASGRV